MKSVLVIGMGRFGRHLAINLVEQGNDVMVIDTSEKRVESIASLVTSAKIGDCTDIEVLKSLGIGNFDLVFVCIGTNFQSSLEITSLVKDLGGKKGNIKGDKRYSSEIFTSKWSGQCNISRA